MAVISIKNKTKSGSLLVGNTAYNPPIYDSIATTTVGSGGTATITFSSIPATYTHLQLRWIARDNRATYNDSELLFRVNSDTGNNYAWRYLRGNGATVEAERTIDTSSWTQTVTASSATNNFCPGVMDILDYANTNKYKTMRTLVGYDNNNSGTGSVGLLSIRSGLWRNTNAITTLTITSSLGSSINQYSSFALYGIKGA